MARPASYDKRPFVPVGPESACEVGWAPILERLQGLRSRSRCVLAVECYPGVHVDEVRRVLTDGLRPALVVDARQAYKDAAEVERLCAPFLGDDPVFGRMNGLSVADFVDASRAAVQRGRIDKAPTGLVLVVGTGAALLAEPDVLVYADLARWEIQQRQRRNEVASLGAHDQKERPGKLYKRGFFVDWRAADRLKRTLFDRIDYLLDTNEPGGAEADRGRRLPPRPGRHGEAALPGRALLRPRPLGRAVDEGGLRPAAGGAELRLVLRLRARGEQPAPRLRRRRGSRSRPSTSSSATRASCSARRSTRASATSSRSGSTSSTRWAAGNLSLQVHPLTEYIQDRFGMHYTQDESYYLLDAGEGACVYLGVKEGIDRAAMLRDLRRAQEAGGPAFPDELYVNRWPAKKHDHFLIPGGTVHCSGKDAMVLEISATPYIFTFKLWDWDRLGLDGRPRPIHVDHGAANIQWERTTAWVERELVNRIEPLGSGEGWREERTGLHEREFIETRRHWFTGTVPHDTGGGVNVLNLVEGAEAVVESPTGAFEPFVVHYAETFIVPAGVGALHDPAPRGGRGDGVRDDQGLREDATVKAFDPGLDVRARREPMGFAYGPGVFGPSPEARSLDAIRPSLRDPACDGPDPVYAIVMDVGREEHRAELQRRHLLFGVVTYAAGRLGDEPVRSQGHVHRVASRSGWSPPELYEIWAGRAIVYMQERAEDDPGRCFAIEAGPGEVVVVPPGWAHATVSADAREPMTFGAWCDREYGFEYAEVRARGGLACFPLLDAPTGASRGGGTRATPRGPSSSAGPGRTRSSGSWPASPSTETFARDPEAVQWVSDPARLAHLWPEFEP